jgi:tRNA(fMet)-specific endonuclease VapC
MLHLDTNVVIALLNGRHAGLRQRFREVLMAGTPVAMSVIVHHELMYGAAHSARRAENERKIALFVSGSRLDLASFDEIDAAEAADIRAYLRRLAQPIGPYDALIAGQARRAGATLVTANRAEFERVPRLVVVDWTA